MASQLEISEPEDGSPIIQPSKSAFVMSNRRRMILISVLLVAFIFPIILVLALTVPSATASNKAARNGILSYARLAPSRLLPGLDDPTIPTIPSDKLVNTEELSLNTSFVVSSTPTVREYQFNISQAYAAPDGFRKLMILVNGQSPGPLIEANAGDTVRVLVHNQLGNMSTSIHWHGIDQKNTTWMDGVTGVTQCAIPPGESFTYEFQLVDQRGTFWYHAHTTMQYTDGLFGPIVSTPNASQSVTLLTAQIIHDPDEHTPEADDDQILFIGDHYHKESSVLRASYLQSSSPWSPSVPGVEPLPDNFLLNGQHTYDCTVNSTTWPASRSDSCTGGVLSVIHVKPNATATRLRLINHSTFFSFWFSIDNHTLTTIEIDGVEVVPIPDQRGVYINVGQRYSVLVPSLPAGGGEGGSYTMRATLPQTCFVPYCPYLSSGLQSIGYEAVGLFSYPSSPSSSSPNILGSRGNTTNPYGAATNPFRGPLWEGCDDMPFSTPVPLRSRPAVNVSGDNSHEVTFRFQQVGEVNRIFINRTSWSPFRDDATIWKTAVDEGFDVAAGGGSYSNFGLRLDQQILLLPDRDMGVQVAINSRDMMEHPFHLQ